MLVAQEMLQQESMEANITIGGRAGKTLACADQSIRFLDMAEYKTPEIPEE